MPAKTHSDGIGLKGRVEIWKRPAESDSKEDWEKIVDQENLVPDAGLNKYRGLIKGSHTDAISDFAFGTSGTSEAAGDTSLGSQVHQEAFDGSTDTATGEVRWNGLVDSVEPSGQPHDIEEFGVLFDDDTLASRITFPAETKDSTQEWRVRYTLTLANA